MQKHGEGLTESYSEVLQTEVLVYTLLHSMCRNKKINLIWHCIAFHAIKHLFILSLSSCK